MGKEIPWFFSHPNFPRSPVTYFNSKWAANKRMNFEVWQGIGEMHSSLLSKCQKLQSEESHRSHINFAHRHPGAWEPNWPELKSTAALGFWLTQVRFSEIVAFFAKNYIPSSIAVIWDLDISKMKFRRFLYLFFILFLFLLHIIFLSFTQD